MTLAQVADTLDPPRTIPHARCMARRWAWLTLGLAACGGQEPLAPAPVSHTSSSPDGAIAATLTLDGGRLSLSVAREGRTVLQPSPLGVETDRGAFVDGLSWLGVEVATVDDAYAMTAGKSLQRSVRANTATITLGAGLQVELRVQNDGVAYRYRLLGDGEVTVQGEASAFTIPAGATAYLAPYDAGGVLLSGSYEQLPEVTEVGAPTNASGWAYPALFDLGEDLLLVTEADLDGRYCGTRLGPEPVGTTYTVMFPRAQEALGVGEPLPTAALPLETPWRVMIVGEPATVVASTLVDDLAQPSRLDDTSWIRPGRASWSWYTQDTGSPALQAEYTDFAIEMGWEYVMVDARWDAWPDPEASVRALTAQGAAAGVEPMLWYNSAGEHSAHDSETPLDRMLDEGVRRDEMTRIADWGVAGIKVDFFESDKQDRIQQYLAILEDAAAAQLLVNFHGATVPRGWQRTWPHLMTTEAVRGGELYRFAPASPPTPDTHVHYVFGRNVVGSMDYTPVIFADALAATGQPYAHSLALAVLFESGLQHFADRADADPTVGYRAVFASFPFVRDFLADVPAVWDETRLLAGHPSSHAVLARRRGAKWYVAAVAGSDDTLDTSIPLDFLDAPAVVTTIEQGADPASLVERSHPVAPGEGWSIALGPSGGLVATFEPAP